jgi:shikimate dehydrogenase
MMNSKLYAVFGNPILHSKSPLMHNALLSNGDFYTRIHVQNALDLVDATKSLKLCGANITAPFKEAVLPFVDELSEEVRLIGGANTLVCKDGKITAFNTDWYGVVKALERDGVSISGKNVLLVGLGGAGKAAAYGLNRSGASLTLANRTLSKAQEVALALGCNAVALSDIGDALARADILVSCLSPGALPKELNTLPKRLVVFDANYHASPLANLALKNGNKVVDAQRWLLYQAAKAYELFTSYTPIVPLMEEALGRNSKENSLTIAVCNTNDCRYLNEELLACPPSEASSCIAKHRPKLVIYTPLLGTNEVEEIYCYERSKAIGS